MVEMARRVCFNFDICLLPFWPFTLWLAAASAALCHPKLRYTNTHSAAALDSFGNYLFHFANRMAEHAHPARIQLRDACRLWYGFKWDALELKYIHFYYLSLITHTQRQRQRQRKKSSALQFEWGICSHTHYHKSVSSIQSRIHSVHLMLNHCALVPSMTQKCVLERRKKYDAVPNTDI